VTVNRLTARIIAAELCAVVVAALLPAGWWQVAGVVATVVLLVVWLKGVALTGWARLWLTWMWRRRSALRVAETQVFNADGIGVLW
jgi:hypothetical protein